jgi:2-oxoglutarate ferredoxin oxidoreductase subunit alpha
MMVELPLVVVNVQRGGPSTGLPTKTEQSDLMQAMYGRNGESPVIVIAAGTPADCFKYRLSSLQISTGTYDPVILLTDGYIANGSEPWKIERVSELPEIKNNKVTEAHEDWHPYDRDKGNLARNWATPGTKGLEHRIGGLEKDKLTGNVSYVPENHEYMTKIRAEKIKRVQNYIPDLKTEFADSGELLVVGWGGTYGSLHSAVQQLNHQGLDSIGYAHFNYINPLPKNTEDVLSKVQKNCGL